MALTRARFVAGDASLGAALAKTVRKTLTGERGAAAIAQATRAMRGLIASYPWAMGRFMMMSDRRRLSRMVRRRDRALTPSCEVERGASALAGWSRTLGVFGPPNARWAKVPRLLLCSSGCHRFANFQSYRFIVAALSDLQLIAANPPVRTCPPGSGRGRFISA
jgi:hypothetical protein